MLLLSAIVFSVMEILLAPFMVVEAQPVLQSLSPTGVAPGSIVTVKGYNFGPIGSLEAIIELQNGEKIGVPIKGNPTATSLDLGPIPNVYEGYDVTAKNSQHRARIQQLKSLYLQRGNTVSNKLTFNISSPYPILDAVHKDPVYPPAYPLDIIIVNGGNWDQPHIMSYYVTFYMPSGTSYSEIVLPPPIQVPTVPFPNLPNITNIGMFTVKIPEVFYGKSQAEQDAIENGTATMSITPPGPKSHESNKLDIKIKKKPINIANPYKLRLAANYRSESPNRTTYYWGWSQINLPYSKGALITNVRNSSAYTIQLSYKPVNVLGNALGPVWLNPGQITGAFNGANASAQWEASGPESGSIVNQYPSISIDISWK
jgi:hypothetical protein